MPRPSNQSTTWDFKVSQVKLITEGGKFSGYFGNQREDTGDILGVTSEQYGIVQNSALLEVAQQAFETRGLKDYEQSIIVSGGGQRMFAEFTFKNRQLASKVGDTFGTKIIVQNSFDRSLRASLSLGLLRLVCLNGAATEDREFSMTRKHSTKFSIDFVGEAIDKAMDSRAKALALYDSLAQKSISDEQGVIILKHLIAMGHLSEKLAECMTTLWLAPKRAEDKGRNLFNLYNAVTEHLTHQVQAERYEYASKTSQSVLMALVHASRKDEKFTKLVTPIPQDKVVMVASGPIIDVEVVQEPAA
jgi:hypothetical protein